MRSIGLRFLPGVTGGELVVVGSVAATLTRRRRDPLVGLAVEVEGCVSGAPILIEIREGSRKESKRSGEREVWGISMLRVIASSKQ